MSLLKCSECGNDVSTAAKACPKCGAPPPKQKSTIPKLPLVFIVIGLVFVATMMAPSAQGPKPPPTVDDYVDGAKYACKAELKKRLHDPDSAKFPPFTEYQVSNDKATHAFVVRVRLRAKNGFGALRLVNAQCLITNMNLSPPGGGMKWEGTAAVDS